MEQHSDTLPSLQEMQPLMLELHQIETLQDDMNDS